RQKLGRSVLAGLSFLLVFILDGAHQQQSNDDTTESNGPQHPENIYIGQQRRLLLDQLADPARRLPRNLAGWAALLGEETTDILHGLLVLDTRRHDIFDQPALMELFSLGQQRLAH